MFMVCKDIKQTFKLVNFLGHLRSRYSQCLKNGNALRMTSKFGRTGDRNGFNGYGEQRDSAGQHHSGDKKSVGSHYSYERGSLKGPKNISD